MSKRIPTVAPAVPQSTTMVLQMLTIKQVAALLGVHRTTVYDFIRNADLPVTHLGARSTRVSATDLQVWLNERREAVS